MSEWIKATTAEQEARKRALAAFAPVNGSAYRPMADSALAADLGLPDVHLTRGDAITPEPIRWIWDGWLAAGKLHMLAGAPGCGKTTAALSFAATLTAGGRWPDGTTVAPGNVLIWSGEDDPKDTLVPRLVVMRADMSKVHFVGGVRIGAETMPFDPAVHLPALASKAQSIGNVRLLLVDPVVSAVPGHSHQNAETRRSLQPLVTLAEQLDCAVLGISHLSKGTGGRAPIDRVNGSLAFVALPRVSRHPIIPSCGN